MKKLILFSSGLDSTYLVYKNLTEGHNVDVVYSELLNNEYKTKIEKQNILKLISLFQEEFPNKIKNLNEDNWFNVFATTANSYSTDLKQSLFWLTTIAQHLKYDNTNFYNQIEIAYVLQDQAVSYINELTNTYKTLCKLTTKTNKQKYPKLMFPLIKTHKVDIFNNLPEKYREHIWSCENPIVTQINDDITISSCGECEPCLTQKRLNLYNLTTNTFILQNNKNIFPMQTTIVSNNYRI